MHVSKPHSPAAHADHSWHAASAESVIDAMGSDRLGLTRTEVHKRQTDYGHNAFTNAARQTFLLRLFKQLRSPLTLVLLIASVLTFALDELVDTAVILFALCMATGIGLLQEGRASRAFERLSGSQTHSAIVIRDGQRHEIDAKQLVPGDIVELQSGMQVPADLRILSVKQLTINEAPLTGEWLAIEKSVESVDVGAPLADRTNMAWKGTFVSDGHGAGIVIATGDHTEMGKIASDLRDIEDEMTPLQWEMRKISRVMFYVIVLLVAAIFFIGLFRGESLETMLVMSIAIAVASIPEGLPAAVTIVLAVSMEALLTRGGLVRNLLAAETLGSTTYILTDKTGTLTEGRMALSGVRYFGQRQQAAEAPHLLGEDAMVREMLEVATCASDAFIEHEDDAQPEDYTIRGEATERAILAAALEAGIALQGTALRSERIDYLSFTSLNRFASGLRKEKGSYRICVNGAPEYLLEASKAVHTHRGSVPMNRGRHQFFLEHLAELSKSGKRVIGVAYRQTHKASLPDDPSTLMSGLTFMGLLVFDDPIRIDVKTAIEGLMRAGAAIRLVTGDSPETALAIARAVGIAREHDVALTGKDIAGFSDEELIGVIGTTRVFARVLPKQKLRLAQILQKCGEIVAMTGDGINDAPALRKANIGVALGSGTEVAKEASDLVLVNDTFATIYAAIEEGRRIIDNLQKIVGYLLATSISEAVLIGTALVVGAPIPIVPVQILWANIIEEGLMSVAFAFEPGDSEAMRQRPRDIHEEGILSKDVLLFIGLVVTILGGLLISLYAFLLSIHMPLAELRSVMFLTVAVDSLFIAFSFRALRVPIWNIPFATNRFFIASFLVSAGMLATVLTIPFMQRLLSYEPLPLQDIALVVAYGFISMLVIELGKYFFFERHG